MIPELGHSAWTLAFTVRPRVFWSMRLERSSRRDRSDTRSPIAASEPLNDVERARLDELLRGSGNYAK